VFLTEIVSDTVSNAAATLVSRDMNGMHTQSWFYFYSFPQPLAEEIG
jgi:hypothetical protein